MIYSKLFSKNKTETKKYTKASYIVSYLIAKKMKHFTEIKFIKECVMSIVIGVCPRRKGVFEKTGLSTRTVT